MPVDTRPFRADDRDHVRRLFTAAFADDGTVARLGDELRARPDPGATLVAVDMAGESERVVGVVQLSTSWVDAPARIIHVLVLSPVGVDPARQGQGIGTRLLQDAVGEATRLGAPLLFLEGDPGYYGPRGWRRADELGFSPPSVRIPPPGFQVVTLPGYDPAVMHGALVYNDTFWRHGLVGPPRG